MKKDQNLQTKTYIVTTAQVNNSQIIQITQETNHPITDLFDTSSHSNSRNRHYSNDRSLNSSYNRNRNYSNNRNRSYSNNRNQRYQNNRSRINSYNRSIYH